MTSSFNLTGTSSFSLHSKLNSYLVSWNIRFPTSVEAQQWQPIANVSVFLWYRKKLTAFEAQYLFPFSFDYLMISSHGYIKRNPI